MTFVKLSHVYETCFTSQAIFNHVNKCETNYLNKLQSQRQIIIEVKWQEIRAHDNKKVSQDLVVIFVKFRPL